MLIPTDSNRFRLPVTDSLPYRFRPPVTDSLQSVTDSRLAVTDSWLVTDSDRQVQIPMTVTDSDWQLHIPTGSYRSRRRTRRARSNPAKPDAPEWDERPNGVGKNSEGRKGGTNEVKQKRKKKTSIVLV